MREHKQTVLLCEHFGAYHHISHTKKLSLVAFFRKGDNFSSHNLVKIHWWQNNFFCVADVMVSTEGLTQERSVFMLSHFSLCLPCHHIILPRFREI